MSIDGCPRMWYAFICLEIFPGYIKRSWRRFTVMSLAKTPGISREGMEVWVSGDPIPFLLRISFFIYLNQENSIYNLLSRFCRPFWLWTFYRPWHWGLILNARFSGRFLGSNHRWYMAETRACSLSDDRYFLPHFPYTQTAWIFLFPQFYILWHQLATWSFVEMLFLFLQMFDSNY